MTHILVASDKLFRSVFDANGTDAVFPWIFPKAAKVGDPAFIYAASQGIFARSNIRSAAKAKDELRWPGVYEGEIGEIRLLQQFVPLNHIRAEMPDFGWPRCPRSFTTVKGGLVGQLESVVADYQKKEV